MIRDSMIRVCFKDASRGPIPLAELHPAFMYSTRHGDPENRECSYR